MTADAIEPSRFDIARVIQQTFAVLGRNIVTFGVLGLVLCGLPAAVVGYLQFEMAKDVFQGASGGSFDFSGARMSGAFLGGLVVLVSTAILQGALIYATVQDLSGTPASVGASLAVGLRNFLALIVVNIILVVACVFGLILLVVPGVMLWCAWCVALPALVADRTGIGGAFGRSADLTRGNRWQIFGLGVLVVVAVWIISAIFNAATGLSAIGYSGGDPFAIAAKAFTPVALIGIVIRQTITTVIGATAVAVMYVELRRARDGGASPDWLREIFS